MSSKNKLVKVGVGLYIIGCVVIGILTGKFLYDYIHASGQPFSWLKTVLAVYAGLLVIGILGIPTHRYTLPKCPKCGNGRLHKKTETLDSHEGPANVKLYFGMRGTQQFTHKRDTISCDRCSYRSVEEHTVEGNIAVH